MANIIQNETPRIMRMAEIIKLTGYGRASIYNFMSEGTFPKSKKLGLRAVGWNSLEVQAWIDARLSGEVA
ncbi:MAG TPA: AlpA family transcriptional regulator [Thiopseudomonas sp.]|nr:AlpA family transcriptional regulator [Thiopseudomonas sp.]